MDTSERDDIMASLASEEVKSEYANTSLECTPEPVGKADAEQVGQLYKYLRIRNRYMAEIGKANLLFGTMVNSLQRKMVALDKAYESIARNSTQLMLEGAKRRSVVTPFGKAGFRAGKEKLVIDKEDMAMEWLKTNLPEALKEKTTVTIGKTEITASFMETGELPPGCHIEPATDKFYTE